jgi:RNA polymerase sigma-70 factor (ECF subfamily)
MPEAGDDWREWLDRHGPSLWLLARRWARCPADADDLVQEGFVRFWRSGASEKSVGYLFSCVRHAALDRLRSDRRRSKREHAAEICPRPNGDPLNHASDAEWTERVQAALARLPAEQQEVVVMRLWAGLTFPQFGEVLDIPAATATSRYRYGIEFLRTQLRAQ